MARLRDYVGLTGSCLVKLVSLEFILDWYANSGGVVALRSVWLTSVVYAAVILLRAQVESIEHETLACHFKDTWPWFGAIFAGVYASLYSRFASQYSYLSNLYNEIMLAEASIGGSAKSEKLQLLWAAFIEDAHAMHLAKKPLFAGLISHLLGLPDVYARFCDSSLGGRALAYEILLEVDAVCAREKEKWQGRNEALSRMISAEEGVATTGRKVTAATL